MKLFPWEVRNSSRIFAAACVASLTPTIWAQQVPPAAAPKNPGVIASEETKKAPSNQEVASKEVLDSGDMIVLSPFEVTASNNGYMATNSTSGTRLNSSLADIASPISVVTKQQLTDMASVDINDIFRSEANVEGLFQYTEFGFDRGSVVDTVSNNPESANRIRGMGAANISYSGNSMSSSVPIDTYNVDSVEISRGANSNIFGIGSTSGTVNINVAEANTTKDFSKISIQGDSYGGKRATFDFNRPLFRDKLGIRILGVHDELGFIRKPSYDKTKRFTVALRAQPFRNTTFKISYETYRNAASRPNMMTPREVISLWQDRGAYTWNPSNFTVYDSSGAPISQVLGNDAGAILLRDTYGLLGGSRIGGSNQVRPTIGYSSGVASYFVSSQTGANGNQRLVWNNPVVVRTQVDDINPVTGLPYGSLFSTIDNLVSVHGDEGKAMYDWTEYNLNAANYARKSSDMTKFQLEHSFFRTDTQQLAAQVSGFYEKVQNDSWNFIGNGGDGIAAVLDVDVNRTLTDGSPNPNYLQPFFSGFQPQRYRRPENNFTNKAQLAYLIDFREKRGILRHLGKHNFLGYGEYRERQYSPSALRYRSAIIPQNIYSSLFYQPAQVPAGYLQFPSDNLTGFNTRYYLGDGSGLNVDSPSSRPIGNSPVLYRYHGGSTNAAVGVPVGWRSQEVTIGTPYFAIGTEKNEIRTKGLIWQGFFWGDRIIPTIGYREDKYRAAANKAFPVEQVGTTIGGTATTLTTTTVFAGVPEGNEFNFQDDYRIVDPKTGATERRGLTRQQGIVVKPFKWLHLTYNQSDSFEPVGYAVDTLGDVLPNPTGESRDYSIRFNLLSDKLWISLNRYEAKQTNSRYGNASVLATRAFRYDFDTGVGADDQGTVGGIGGTDLFDFYYLNIVGNGGTEPGDPTYRANNGLDTTQKVTDHIYGLMGYTKEQVSKTNGAQVAATQDIESDGYELEVNYNTKFWSMKVTGAKRDARDTALGPALKQYLDWRMPVWKAATYTNQTVGDPQFGQATAFWTTGNRENDFNNVVNNPYNITVANLGKTRPQLRQYSVNLTTSYRLAGISSNSVLKNMRTGIFASWNDKASIGYGYAAPELNTTTGEYVVRSLDANKRYYDKARTTMDWWLNYEFRMFSGRIKSSLQFNVKNVFEDGRLQAVAVNSDGTPWAYRIIDPRKFILTLNMEL
jgi:outer membrane receptor protein involved in Fe transport